MTQRKSKTDHHDKPWDNDNPKPKNARETLTGPEKTRARKRAEAAGRPYPNLVDNMAVARDK